MNWWWVGGGLAFLVLVAQIGEQSGPQTNAISSKPSSDSARAEPKKSLAQGEVKSAWEYTEQSDPMNDRMTELACVNSNNEVDLDFPYGDVGGRLCLRNSPQYGRDAFVSLNGKGQILCSSYDGCTIRIRFDNEAARKFSASAPSDHSSETVFINERTSLEKRLPATARVAIQLEFYQAGQQSLVFDTSGFSWERLKAAYKESVSAGPSAECVPELAAKAGLKCESK